MKTRVRRVFFYALIALGILLLMPAAVVLLLRWVDPPVTAFMLRSHFEARTSGANGPTIFYTWVDIDDIAPCLPLAVVASEDQTFPAHHGFVWSAIGDALADNAEGGPVRGASSITQQTAKNLFLWPAKSYIRKAIEAYIALWLELLWSKQRILEVYLNIAQFDARVFGAGAAADRLFGIEADALSDAQCAALAAVLPAPTRYSARDPGPYVQQQSRWIRRQMRQLGSDYLDGVLQR